MTTITLISLVMSALGNFIASLSIIFFITHMTMSIINDHFPDMIIVNTELQPQKEGVTIDQKKQKLSIYLFLLSAIV